jgi:hypothetical protein
MHVMLQNRGTTPLPIGTPDAGGYENLLAPGIEVAIARDDLETLVFGEQPEVAGRSKLAALAIDPASPLAVEYGTNIDQWKGRSDPDAEQASMNVVLFVKNVGADPVTLTTTEGVMELLRDQGVQIETLAGLKMTGVVVPPPEPDPNLQITGFTASMDPTCTITGRKGLENGDTVALAATGGDPDAMAAIDGHEAPVYNVQEYSFQISNLDLTGANVVGLMGTGIITVAPPDVTGTITAFTPTSPTEATMDSEDQGMLMAGDFITLEALSGDPEAMAAINALTVEVLTVGPVTLGLDLSLVDVTGLTADFVVG